MSLLEKWVKDERANTTIHWPVASPDANDRRRAQAHGESMAQGWGPDDHQ